MLTKMILVLLGAATTMKVAQAGQNLRLLENDECPADNVECDTIEDQVEDADDLKVFERAQVPSDPMYFKSPTYQGKDREVKIQELWNMLVPTFEQNPELNDEEPLAQPWADFPEIFRRKGNGAFCQSSDQNKKKRKKILHSQGLVAKVSWIPATGEYTTPYTGMYSQQHDEVILRLSETQLLTDVSTGLQPSLALKFLRDGFRSSNLFAMTGMKPTTSWDFFKEKMSSRLEPFDQSAASDDYIYVNTIQKQLIEGSKRPFASGVSHVARQNADGSIIEDKAQVVAPYELHYNSTFDFTNPNLPPETDENSELVDKLNWYDRLKNIPVGEDLLEVWAWSAPKSCDGEYEKIAYIRLQTKLYTSQAGDEKLYFQHRRVGADRRYWDSCAKNLNEDLLFERNENTIWGNGDNPIYDNWPSTDEAAEDEYALQLEQYDGCPFGWLLEE